MFVVLFMNCSWFIDCLCFCAEKASARNASTMYGGGGSCARGRVSARVNTHTHTHNNLHYCWSSMRLKTFSLERLMQQFACNNKNNNLKMVRYKNWTEHEWKSSQCPTTDILEANYKEMRGDARVFHSDSRETSILQTRKRAVTLTDLRMLHSVNPLWYFLLQKDAEALRRHAGKARSGAHLVRAHHREGRDRTLVRARRGTETMPCD